jgi:hypothetical protein
MNDDAKNLQLELNLPPIHQIGLITRDIKTIMATYASLFRVGPFTICEFSPDKHWYNDELVRFKALYAQAVLGDVELCLMQPLEGKGIHMEYLTAKREGLFNSRFLFSG